VLLELIVFHMSEDSLFDELRSWPWSVEAVWSILPLIEHRESILPKTGFWIQYTLWQYLDCQWSDHNIAGNRAEHRCRNIPVDQGYTMKLVWRSCWRTHYKPCSVGGRREFVLTWELGLSMTVIG
jgi:hypothetical protein